MRVQQWNGRPRSSYSFHAVIGLVLCCLSSIQSVYGETASSSSQKNIKTDQVNGRRMINTTMKEKDFAAAMGDAIRRESPEFVLHADDNQRPLSTSQRSQHHPYFRRIDTSLTSIGSGIGSSDVSIMFSSNKKGDNDKVAPPYQRRRNEDAGGVEASGSAVLVNYFLKSHGGVHGLQSACSLLCTLFGIGSLFIPTPKSNPTTGITSAAPFLLSTMPKLIWLRRCIVCALTKHLSGFMAATWVCAYRFTQVGWNDTRKRMEALATDAVSQYLFYCATLILWTSSSDARVGRVAAGSGANPMVATSSSPNQSVHVVALPWWLDGSPLKCFIITLSLIGPILLREAISTLWVFADSLVLLQSAQAPTVDEDDEFNAQSSPVLDTLFYTGRASVHTFMNLFLKFFLPTSQKNIKWKDMDSITRQLLLAKFTSQLSLGMELTTGCIVVYDAIRAFWEYSILPVGSTLRPSVRSVAVRLVCARLLINFLLVRKREKVKDLFTQMSR